MRDVEGYDRAPRRRVRPAWSVANLGNAAARTELLDALLGATEAEVEGGAPLLDCGSGTGWLLEALAAAGVAPDRLHGVDVDAGRVVAARRRAPGATVVVGEGTALPYPDASFAAVYFVVSLSSMGSREQVRKALTEGRRVLAPGGALVIYEPRLPNPFNRATRCISRADLRAAGIVAPTTRTLTLLPPLGRRLGRSTERLHPLLSRVAALRSHRLVVHRERKRPSVAMLLHKSVEHDSRVRRAARALQQAGHDVTVVHLPPTERGRREGTLDGFRLVAATPPPWVRTLIPFHAYRVTFLASFVRAILRERPDVVHAHDAAMLLPAYAGARLVGARVVYDSHELATGVPYRERWWAAFVAALERLVVPRCAAVITVSDGIATRLQERYNLANRPTVVRNIPDLEIERQPSERPNAAGPLRARLGVGAAPLILHQGALAPRRGCEAAVRAMAHLPDAHLVFLGDAWPGYAGTIESLAAELVMSDRVHVLPSVPVSELLSWTREADVGLSLLDGDCENHRLALPNKVFEYVAAGVPVVVGDLPELRALLDCHAIGAWCDATRPDRLAAAIRDVLDRRSELAGRVAQAQRVLTWDLEKRALTDLYRRLGDGDVGRSAAGALIFVRNGVTHDARVRREARELQRSGRRPTVVGVVTPRDPRPRETIDDIPVRRLRPGSSLRRWRAPAPRTAAEPSSSAGRRRDRRPYSRPRGAAARVRRVAVALDWYRQGIAVVRRERPALVHCNDFNTMWIGVAAKLLYRAALIYDAHELWPDRNLRPEPRWWLLACEWLFVRVADEVLTTSPAYADVIARRYRVERPTVVRNVPRFDALPGHVERSVPGGLVVYFGAVTSGRGLEVAIEALQQVDDLRLRIVGPDAWGFREILAETARDLALEDRVELLGPVPPGEAPVLLADADAGLALIEPVCLSYRLTLPNKLFEYMAAGLPVLATDLPAMSELLAETGAGITVDRVDARSVAEGLREVVEPRRNAELRTAAKAAARRITWEAERELLSRAYDRAMEARP